MDTSTPDGPEPYDQFEDEDDFQLVEWIVEFKETDSDTARAAWGCLYLRHREYLYKVTRRTARDAFGHDGAAEDVVANTFRKLYEKADTFKPPDEVLDRDRKRNCLRAWLGKIAENEIRDAQRKHQRHPDRNIDQDHWADIEGCSDAVFESADTAWVREVMDRVLDSREQDILRTTYRYYDPSRDQPPRLPSDEIQRLCREHGITAENLRQIRGRAMKKLSDALTAANSAG